MTNLVSRASAAQEALCALHEMDPATPGLVLELALRIPDGIPVRALVDAFGEIIARHAALRTRFVRDDAGWLAMVDPADHGQRARWCRVEDGQNFAAPPVLDLAGGPLFEVRIRPAARQVLVRAHHAVIDLWSVGLLMAEVLTLLADGKPHLLRSVVRPVPDRARERERAWTYWRELLADGVEPLSLPGAADAGRARRSEHAPVDFGPERTARVHRLAHECGVTRYAVLVAAQALALGRFTGTDRLPVGVPLHGRDSSSYQDIGYHVSTVAVPVDLGDRTVRELVAEAGGRVRGALAHQVLGYPELVARAGAEHGPPIPLPTAAVVLQQDPPGAPAGLAAALLGLGTLPFGDRELTVAQPPPAIGPFGLATLLVEHENRLLGRVETDSAAHPPWFAAAFATCLVAVVDAMTAGADTALTDLDIPVAGRPELTRPPVLPVSATDTLHDVVLATAQHYPQRTAVSAQDGSLTYVELATRSAAVAAGLAGAGVRPGAAVGVALARRRDLPAVLLGVLRAGASYVPLDPTGPPGRQSEIVANAGCALVVTDRAGVRRLREHDIPAATVDQLCRASSVAPARTAGCGRTAYVLFTSGSTGRPKGVAITHGSAVNLVRWAETEFTPAELARTLAVTPITFDLSVFELFVPLATGGTVCLLDGVLDLIDPPAHAAGPTLLNTVPSAVATLVQRTALPRSLRAVNMAGEPVPADLVRKLAAQLPAARLLNLYGPSETTTYSTYAELGASTTDPVPIGGPVGGTSLSVVDAGLRPVPVGAVGELVIGGAGVAAGYLGQAGLTARRFLPDPAGGGMRCYRTGDRVRLRSDGRLDFVGRTDDQVKVRGFRIELGDVENGLRRVADLQDVVVCATGDGHDRHLVAYLVSAAAPTDDLAGWLRGIRQALLAELPGYLVPTAYAVLPSLPRTPHGKVDRRRLADVRVERLAARHQVEPRTNTERRVARLWGVLLGEPDIGITEDFIALGGHSLMLARLAHLLTEEFTSDVLPGQLWRCRTVAEQAALVDAMADTPGARITGLDRSRYTTAPTPDTTA